MVKSIVEKIIRFRNPTFQFDKQITSYILLALLYSRFFCWLRGLKLLLYLKKPNFLFIGKGVKFFNTPNISFGKWVQIQEHSYLSALGTGKLEIGNNVSIGAYSRIIISTSFNNIGKHIKIGNNVGMGEFACLGGAGGLDIGDDCIIGSYLSCHPENHNFQDAIMPIRFQGVSRKGIKIGKNCWIGAKVTILDGVTIGNNCVIAAGAVITKSMPANTVIGGIPAKVLKNRINENFAV